MSRNGPRPLARGLLALGLPAAGILGPVTVLLLTRAQWFGLPAAVLWLFGCLPLTALCLFLASRTP
ncbi:hypothetical protein [Acidomonas methanolica]|uniref:Uncharacterized protein n=1 Tax=Acidomonas methanolica NBRC 104435 TaxID=1231351 RepID=A0A023D8D1_ACIMT|nr:hypothetical protein [Acidomonas methanolica]MBU2654665.1 hypothetical protein [Acidomonas methanolica]TCS27334.1 hypothetical protein EDC31_11154 [Acidomonas methanolica]GAJ29985.1 hypothetical protein Amme_093_009 [Acidomonas methanolica NBRC 104435]GBQ53962.1 hypothetical protein AA0498_2032 [Acidomonas methanolica]GEK99641.1 hypothetical protein AME01nite_21400 [Acidomonas methanolica NBRC 104435]